ncbi:MAG: MBL fold metallo-hydrolase [Kiritimatiellae bacterium]|nr:MBL fold metallo-hydrolase [Kiritimatiellia bacterium]
MNIVFLGTGTSSGVPVIGCACAVCRSSDPRNKRRRSSLYVQAAGQHIIIDTPPDFRDQVLAFGVRRVDAVLITHAHADHIFGFDDIRRFNEVQDAVIPAYGSPDTIAAMDRFFPYVHQVAKPGLSYPRVDFRTVTAPFAVGPVHIDPLLVEHAGIETYGYRLEADGRTLGYVPDCQRLSAAVVQRLRGLDCVILDGLRRKYHPTHFTLDQSVAELQRLGARRAFITHMTHDLDYETTAQALPSGIDIPYDGLIVDV